MRIIMISAALFMAACSTSSWAAPKKPKPDLADIAKGVYLGSVISDSRGAGRPNVTITVTKTAPNTVTVSSDYSRLPSFTAKLAQYMQTIQMTGSGGQVFLLELAKTLRNLNITDDQASWSGVPVGEN